MLLLGIDETLGDNRVPPPHVVHAWKALTNSADVVLASSRTVDELLFLLGELQADADLIAENGACVAVRSLPLAQALGATERLSRFGRRWFVACRGLAARQVVAAMGQARTLHGADVRFAHEVPRGRRAELLDSDYRTRLALARRCSALAELPARTPANDAWLETLQRAGYQAEFGRQWLTIWRGPDKGDAASAYLAACAQAGVIPTHVAAIADGPSDSALLRTGAATRFVVNRACGGHDASVLAIPGTVPLAATAHRGWGEALRRLARAPTDAVVGAVADAVADAG
jgi:predicted mannosyl-3-phosphoglycerate phosphatase (HAD superfamily)